MQQDLILGCSEHIKTLACALRQMPHFTQRWRGFLGGKICHPGSHLCKQKNLLLSKAGEMRQEMKAYKKQRQETHFLKEKGVNCLKFSFSNHENELW